MSASGSGSQAMVRRSIAEADSTGQYERYHMSISNPHPMKIVYQGIDKLTGIKINWSKIVLELSTEEDEETKKKKFKDYCNEPQLLQSLQHPNIIKCYHYWPDDTLNNTFHMINEAFNSENLRDYSLKYHLVGNKQAIRIWCKQILSALDYLHSQNPPIMHRDVSLENIFINGNTGKVKLGEFGVAIKLEEGADLQEFACTPEYMAPEIFLLDYNEKADIYSFGMCLLQMMSREKIYSECRNRVEIQSRVQRGIMPEAIERVADTEIRGLIDFCCADQHDRPAASELLRIPLFLTEDGFKGIRTGESSRGLADADERQPEMTQGGGGGGGSKPNWRHKLSKMKSILRKKN